MALSTFWAIFSQTHLATLPRNEAFFMRGASHVRPCVLRPKTGSSSLGRSCESCVTPLEGVGMVGQGVVPRAQGPAL
jgi:hypothetical protein